MIKKVFPAAMILTGLLVMAFGLSYYSSPLTRLELYGIKLTHRVAHQGPAHYLVGWQASLESWTEEQGSLDTPLVKEKSDEVSTLLVERQPGTPTQNVIRISSLEWIQTLASAQETKNLTIPLNHPSIAAGRIILDKQGTLLEREEGDAWRMGRALQFLVPRFPKGTLRRGSRWTEHVAWIEIINNWKVRWDADLDWSLKGFENRYESPCVRLSYSAALKPTLLQEAYWAKGTAGAADFSGKGSGEAYYNIPEKTLISNHFTYSGTIKIPISHLERVPEELRVGTQMSEGSGTVMLKIEDAINIQLP